MNVKKVVISLLAGLWCICAGAQFYNSGTDAGSTRWNSIRTSNYEIIYPRGLDSLAVKYAVSLERYRGSVGIFNEYGSGVTPVVLHADDVRSNGMVVWSPKRMELLTTPEAYRPFSLPWADQLAVHEGRHIAQMQLGYEKKFKWLRVLTGEITPSLINGVYGGPFFLEGDAVLAETALSESGRGRTADFLEYYRVSLSEGWKRGWWQWLYGSDNRYYPNHYALGYMMNSELSTMYGKGSLTGRFYDNIISAKGYPFFVWQKTVRRTTGFPKLKDSFSAVQDSLEARWKADRNARGPFNVTENVTPAEKYYVNFRGNAVLDGKLYSIKSGLYEADNVVEILPDGTSRSLFDVGPRTSQLKADTAGHRLFWSETSSDERWELVSWSNIKYWSAISGKVVSLTEKGRYFNPAVSEEGAGICAIEYPREGGSSLVILNLAGQIVEKYPVPSEIQAVECAWLGEDIYYTGISENGFSIWKCGLDEPVLECGFCKVNGLFVRDGSLMFTCDMDGTNELYCFNPDNGNFKKTGNFSNGASDFCFDGLTLYMSVPHENGRLIEKAGVLALTQTEPSRYSYPTADRLSAAFRKTADNEAADVNATSDNGDGIVIGESREYKKLSHLGRIHSWLPAYADIDDISSLSYETLRQNLSPGVTAFFQNDLGSFDGLVAAGYRRSAGGWNPVVVAKCTYRGLYPVFSIKGTVSGKDALWTGLRTDGDGNIVTETGVAAPMSASITADCYIPLKLNSGGWNRGIIPQISASAGNTSIRTGESSYTCLSNFVALIHIYNIRNMASSQIYPRWGLGLAAGYYSYGSLSNYLPPVAFAKAYGYLPGFGRSHGIRLSAVSERNLGGGVRFINRYYNTAPRGICGQKTLQTVNAFQSRNLVSADYVLPLWYINSGIIDPIAYLKTLELNIHADAGLYRHMSLRGMLAGAGTDITLKLGNFLWFPYDTRIGLSTSVGWAPDIKDNYFNGYRPSFDAAMIFSMDF